ncbi:Ankyrin 2 [Carabus blaptoides fortunei]
MYQLFDRIKSFGNDDTLKYLYKTGLELDNAETLRYCLDMGISPNERIVEGSAGLHVVAGRGYMNLLGILLNEPNIDINIRNTNGKTPLYIASTECREEMVIELLARGANVNIADENGYTPLHKAVLWKYQTIVRILLAYKPNVNAENVYGKTPLYIASLDSPCIPIIKMLIESGADVNMENGKTLHLIIECALSCYRLKNVEVVEILLDNGANVNITEPYTKRTALHKVAITGYLPLARALLNRGADKTLKDFKGYTPYELAIKYKQMSVADLLANK